MSQKHPQNRPVTQNTPTTQSNPQALMRGRAATPEQSSYSKWLFQPKVTQHSDGPK